MLVRTSCSSSVTSEPSKCMLFKCFRSFRSEVTNPSRAQSRPKAQKPLLRGICSRIKTRHRHTIRPQAKVIYGLKLEEGYRTSPIRWCQAAPKWLGENSAFARPVIDRVMEANIRRLRRGWAQRYCFVCVCEIDGPLFQVGSTVYAMEPGKGNEGIELLRGSMSRTFALFC